MGELMKTMVQRDGKYLYFADLNLKMNRDIVLEASKQNGSAIQFACEELRSDGELARIAVRQSLHNLNYLSNELRANREFILEALQAHPQDFGPLVLELVPQDLRIDREIVTLAARRHSFELQFTS